MPAYTYSTNVNSRIGPSTLPEKLPIAVLIDSKKGV